MLFKLKLNENNNFKFYFPLRQTLHKTSPRTLNNKRNKETFLLSEHYFYHTSEGITKDDPPLKIPPYYSGAKRRKIFLLRKSLRKNFGWMS